MPTSTKKKSPARKSPPTKKPAVKKAAPKKAAPKKAAAKKKPAAKKPAPAKKPVEAKDEPVKVYTLAELGARHGEASEAEVMGLLDQDREELRALGATVATPRIETDAARIYGRISDVWRARSAEQRKALVGLSEDLLRIAVAAARRGSELHTARTEAIEKTSAELRRDSAEADTLRAQGLARREQIHRSLRFIAGGDRTRLADVKTAYGLSEDNKQLGASLKALAGLGRSFLGDSKVRSRAGLVGVGEPFLEAVEQLAEQLARAPLTTGVRAKGEIEQPLVDLWDGVNLVLLKHVLAAWEAARSLDPTLPSLYPISLQGVGPFRRASSAKPAAPSDAPRPPSPPAK